MASHDSNMVGGLSGLAGGRSETSAHGVQIECQDEVKSTERLSSIYEMLNGQQMQSWVFALIPHSCHKHLYFCHTHSQNSRQGCQRERLHGSKHMFTLVSPNLLQPRILGPSANGYLARKVSSSSIDQTRVLTEGSKVTYLYNLIPNIFEPCFLDPSLL